MPGITVKVRNKELMKELDDHPDFYDRIEQGIRDVMKKMSGVDVIDFDYIQPRRSTAKADIEFDVEYSVRDGGLMPPVTSNPEWTKNAADEMRELIECHFLGYIIAVWFKPQVDAGYSESKSG